MKERVGVFYISLNNVVNNKKEVSRVLGGIGFIPTDVKYSYHKKEFRYIGYSDSFEEIEEGGKAPEYNLEVNIMNPCASIVRKTT